MHLLMKLDAAQSKHAQFTPPASILVFLHSSSNLLVVSLLYIPYHMYSGLTSTQFHGKMHRSVLDRASIWRELLIKEALHIGMTPVDKHVNRDAEMEIPGCWVPTLKRI